MEKAITWNIPETLPLSFLYGGAQIEGWPKDVQTTVEETQRADGARRTVVRGAMQDGLEIRLECVRYEDFAAAEYTAYLTNCGQTDSKLVEGLRLSCRIEGEGAELIHGNGDTVTMEGYRWQRDALPQTLSPTDGTSCRGAFPYMRLAFPEGTVNLAIGWPTCWEARFAGEASGVRVSAGQKRCRMVIHPGETIRTPSLTLQFVAGDPDRAANQWRRWYFAHVMPRRAGRPLKPMLCLHYWMCEGKPEHTAATEENQIRALESYVGNGLTPDVWWIDAGWYPCDYVWTRTGTWVEDPKRFPRGLRPIGDACKAHGADFLLWFEPERVQPGTWLDEHHPEWLLKRRCEDGSIDCNRLLNLGDPACCDALIDHVDAFIKRNGVSIYRQDFNFDPAPFWAENEAEDRIGAMENLHGQGYLRYWDALLARNPGLLIDSCASGGRRNDLESMRRAVPLHYTDMGYGNHPIKQLQHRQMFEWIPYFRAHNMNWDRPDHSYGCENHGPDEYAYHVALAPALTDMTPYNASPEAFALARRMTPLWRCAAEIMLEGDYYPLTPRKADAADFYAMQFHCPNRGAGFVSVVSNVANGKREYLLRMRELDRSAVYRVTDGDATWENTGAALSDGVTLQMPPRSGALWFYERID